MRAGARSPWPSACRSRGLALRLRFLETRATSFPICGRRGSVLARWTAGRRLGPARPPGSPPGGTLRRPGPGFARYFHPAARALCAAATGTRSGARLARAVHTPCPSPPCTDSYTRRRGPGSILLAARFPASPSTQQLPGERPAASQTSLPTKRPPPPLASPGAFSLPRERTIRPHRLDSVPGLGRVERNPDAPALGTRWWSSIPALLFGIQ